MKLTSEQVVTADRRADRNAVLGFECDDRWIGWHAAIRMRDAIPAHVRDFEPRISRLDPNDPASEHAEPRAIAFFAVLEQHLHAEADSEIRPAAAQIIAHRIIEPTFDEFVYEHAERALSRHDELVRAPDHLRIASDDNIST